MNNHDDILDAWYGDSLPDWFKRRYSAAPGADKTIRINLDSAGIIGTPKRGGLTEVVDRYLLGPFVDFQAGYVPFAGGFYRWQQN